MYASSRAAPGWPTFATIPLIDRCARSTVARMRGNSRTARSIRARSGELWDEETTGTALMTVLTREGWGRAPRPYQMTGPRLALTASAGPPNESTLAMEIGSEAPKPRVLHYAHAPRLPEGDKLDLRALGTGAWVELEVGPGPKAGFLIE